MIKEKPKGWSMDKLILQVLKDRLHYALVNGAQRITAYYNNYIVSGELTMKDGIEQHPVTVSKATNLEEQTQQLYSFKDGEKYVSVYSKHGDMALIKFSFEMREGATIKHDDMGKTLCLEFRNHMPPPQITRCYIPDL